MGRLVGNAPGEAVVRISLVLAVTLAMFTFSADSAQPDEKANYDESKVLEFALPDPLLFDNGHPVKDAQDWFEQRRPQILQHFRSEIYGRTPDFPEVEFDVREVDREALGGHAIRKVVAITTRKADKQHTFDLVIYAPKSGPRPLPTFVGILLFDKHAETPHPGVPLEIDAEQLAQAGIDQPLPGAELLKAILGRGYAVASIDAQEVAPDDAHDYRQGIIGLLSGEEESGRQPDDWGAIGAWAWALSRAVDYLQTDREFDAKRIGAIGHSRRGKTALWAGAQDPRFSLVISNESGCGGAALSRRRFGETVKLINDRFPHWFSLNFRKYNEIEDDLPVDQHQLIALIAPRPVYVGSAVEDRWADPRGEYLACVHADPVYQLLGLTGLGVTEMPPVNHSVGKTIGYHIRSGKHALTDFDWLLYLDFADRHWKFVRASLTGDI